MDRIDMDFLERLTEISGLLEGVVALAAILSYFHKKIIGFFKLKGMGTIERQMLHKERLYLQFLIDTLRKAHKTAQKHENYFHIALKAEIKKIDYNRNAGIKKKTNLISQNSTTKNLVKTLQKSRDFIVVLLGHPGSGKSATLRHLGIVIAKQEVQWFKSAPYIPIYISLGKYTRTQDGNDSPEEVIEFLKRELCTQGGHQAHIGEKIKDYIEDGRLWLLFDAMDEMPRLDYEKRYDKLMDFAEKWNQNKFIFSCRVHDYDERFPVREIQIKEFDPSQIRGYLNKALGSKKKAKKVLYEIQEKKPDIFELASNPFFLSLITSLVKNSAKKDELIPDNRAGLFDEFVNRFLPHEKEKWSYAQGEWIGDENFKTVIYRIAFMITQERGMGTTVTERFIFEHFNDDERFNGLKQHLDVVLEIGKRRKLLIADEVEETIQFQHHRFQEYFTAKYLEQYQSNIEREYYDDIWWQEIIKMYTGISPKANQLIGDILNEADKIFAEINNNLPYDIRRLLLDRVILASDCAKILDNSINKDLEERVVKYFLYFKEKGATTIEKVKSIRGLANFKQEWITDAFIDFLKDESRWVRKTALAEVKKRKLRVRHTVKLTIRLIGRPFHAFFRWNFNLLKLIIRIVIFFAIIGIVAKIINFFFFNVLQLWSFDKTREQYIAAVILGIIGFYYTIVLIVAYTNVFLEKRKLRKLAFTPDEQRPSARKLFLIVSGSNLTTLRKMAINALMTTSIPEEDIISVVTELARGIKDQKFLDYLWKSVEILEKRQIRKQFHGVEASTFAEKFFKYGKIKMFQREFDAAIKNFDHVIKLQSENRIAYYFRGVTKMESKDFSGAIADFTRLIELEPHFPRPYVARADAKIEQGLFYEALDDFTMALKIEPSLIDVMVRRAALQSHLEKYEKALTDCNNILEFDPMNIGARFIRGNLRMILNNQEELKGAIADFNKVIQFNSQNVEALAKRAYAHALLGNYRKANNDCAKIIKLAPQLPISYYVKGMTKYGTKDYHGAIEECTKAIELNPKYGEVYYTRGMAKKENKDYEGAIKDFNTAIEIDPTIYDAYLHRGLANIFAGRKVEGCKDLAKAKELYVSNASRLLQKYCTG